MARTETANDRELRRRYEARVAAEDRAARDRAAIVRARERRRRAMMIPTMLAFRRDFEQLRRQDAELDPRDAGVVSERGLRTAWLQLRCLHIRACAEHRRSFRTCKPQIARAMSKRGRPRSTSTVQRTNRRLERMGYCDARHVHKRLMRVQERDCLQITMTFALPAVGSPPPRTTCRGGGAAGATGEHDRQQDHARPPPAAGIASPDGDSPDTPAAPAGTQEGEKSSALEGAGALAGASAPVSTGEPAAGLQRRPDEPPPPLADP